MNGFIKVNKLAHTYEYLYSSDDYQKPVDDLKKKASSVKEKQLS